MLAFEIWNHGTECKCDPHKNLHLHVLNVCPALESQLKGGFYGHKSLSVSERWRWSRVKMWMYIVCVCVCISCEFALLFARFSSQLMWLPRSPEVTHGLNHSRQAVCSIILLCPAGTSAAHADNLVSNWEEHGLRRWSNYLYIKRPRWNRRTSDAGSARPFKQETWRELARAGFVSGRRIKSQRGLYFQWFPFFIVIFTALGWC